MECQLDSILKTLLDPLFRYAMALAGNENDAGDLVQETLLKTISNRHRFEQMENKRAWVMTVMTNVFRDRMRQHKRRPDVQTLISDPVDQSGCPEFEMELLEQQKLLVAQFQNLPTTQRQVMYLKCVEQYSVQQIAEVMSTTANSVKASLSIARKKLREFVNRQVLER